MLQFERFSSLIKLEQVVYIRGLYISTYPSITYLLTYSFTCIHHGISDDFKILGHDPDSFSFLLFD